MALLEGTRNSFAKLCLLLMCIPCVAVDAGGDPGGGEEGEGRGRGQRGISPFPTKERRCVVIQRWLTAMQNCTEPCVCILGPLNIHLSVCYAWHKDKKR